MAFDITREDKIAINVDRIANLNREGYNNEIALKTAESALVIASLSEEQRNDLENQVETFKRNIEIIEAAITVAQNEIAGNA